MPFSTTTSSIQKQEMKRNLNLTYPESYSNLDYPESYKSKIFPFLGFYSKLPKRTFFNKKCIDIRYTNKISEIIYSWSIN
jgi:hypothetical protein